MHYTVQYSIVQRLSVLQYLSRKFDTAKVQYSMFAIIITKYISFEETMKLVGSHILYHTVQYILTVLL